jgi:ribosomal protein S25
MFARYKLTDDRVLPTDQTHNLNPRNITHQAARLPLKKAANNPSTTHWLSDELLQRVKNDIATAQLTRLSFRHLQRTYQISHATAKSIRQALLKEGIAKMDETTHQLTLTGKHH